ncbi:MULTISPECIES: hypothetical protein [unclassified Rathayibacter]|uniref:hypothetical protein n=1 Tax=unclassified Rathayibacter TaxID=2609250 RepID=UPI000CE72229|nr:MULTISPECIES: hypothetical protein [unclassified Rathayibacter]PPF11601.1 hypothetical protein C5B98_07605 [Rathayibacter sp. AY1A5]PPH90570.1 hypothetical protein C5C64_07760 [Rathayibacter sp. AY1D3]
MNPTLDNTLLLSPLIVPPEAEMKKALLLSERFSTIAPRGFPPTETLAEMKERGWWIPAHLDDLDESTRDRAVRECIDAAGRYSFTTDDWKHSDRLFARKLPYELEHWLVENDYLRPASDDGSEFRASRENLVPGLLAICGRRLCQANGWQYGVATTATARQALFSIDEATDERALALTLYDIPEPHPDATFEDIVAFRQSKEKLLARYLDGLRDVRLAVAEAEDGRELEDALLTYKARVSELHRASGPLKGEGGGRLDPMTLLIPMTEVGVAVGDWLTSGPSFAPIVLAVRAVASVVTLRRHDATSYLSAAVAKNLIEAPESRAVTVGLRD